jgi:hypothetical protein
LAISPVMLSTGQEMEYTNERVNKESEAESLSYFLEVYEGIIGESLNSVESSERPDFIATRKDGSLIGIELSKIRRGHPNDILYDKIIEKKDYMSVYDALCMIQRVVYEKEKKRNNLGWLLPDTTILLLELTDIPLSELRYAILPNFLPDLYETSFAEIWLVDLTGVEAYDNVELYCVYPKELEGYYPRNIQKPYG